MPCCSAVNCTNRSEKGWRLFRFPTGTRRAKWVQNSRRGNNWTPNGNSRLCETHFEESQFENCRQDGWKKLKPNAIPTLFDVPNPPPRIDPLPRKSLYKEHSRTVVNAPVDLNATKTAIIELKNIIDDEKRAFKQEPDSVSMFEEPEPTNLENETDELSQLRCENSKLRCENSQLRDEVCKLKELINQKETENKKLQQQFIDIDASRRKFLSDGQIQMLEQGRVSQWPYECIVKGLKLRFALSVHGYNYLRSTGYPLPSYSTIMRRVQDFQLEFGIFKDVLELLKFKVAQMEPDDRFCVVSYDEMHIKQQLDYNKRDGKFVGYATMASDLNSVGEKIYLVVVRGIKNRWKQIIGCHVTCKAAIDAQILRDFTKECISAAENVGLVVLSLSSDLDSRNRSLWTSLNIHASRIGLRRNSFIFNNHQIYAHPDPCHLLKNLKCAVLRQTLYLPEEFVETEQLPTNEVNGTYVKQLWEHEMSNGCEKRLLHHLRREDMDPTNFEKMNVGAAVRFFSPKTYSALKTAIENKILSESALTTAYFILVIHEWFSIMSSKVRKTAITSRNCDRKYIFLHTIIDLFQNAIFGSGWKPLNYGFVLSTLSFCDTAEFLMKNGFHFVLGHRFCQDATENIFSTIRNKAGSLPTALEALRAIRFITVSQFVSDVKRSNYVSDSDVFLLNFCKEKKSSNAMLSTSLSVSLDVSAENITTSQIEFYVQTFSLEDFCEMMNQYDANSTFYIAGSTTNAVQKHVCNNCLNFLNANNLPDTAFIKKAKSYTTGVNRGGLKEPCVEVLSVIFHCEYYFTIFKNSIVKNGNSDLVKCLVDNVDIFFPECCNMKGKIIRHFFNVRSYCLKNFIENSKFPKLVYGTASAKKKKN